MRTLAPWPPWHLVKDGHLVRVEHPVLLRAGEPVHHEVERHERHARRQRERRHVAARARCPAAAFQRAARGCLHDGRQAPRVHHRARGCCAVLQHTAPAPRARLLTAGGGGAAAACAQRHHGLGGGGARGRVAAHHKDGAAQADGAGVQVLGGLVALAGHDGAPEHHWKGLCGLGQRLDGEGHILERLILAGRRQHVGARDGAVAPDRRGRLDVRASERHQRKGQQAGHQAIAEHEEERVLEQLLLRARPKADRHDALLQHPVDQQGPCAQGSKRRGGLRRARLDQLRGRCPAPTPDSSTSPITGDEHDAAHVLGQLGARP